jgi:hypothetical protein
MRTVLIYINECHRKSIFQLNRCQTNSNQLCTNTIHKYKFVTVVGGENVCPYYEWILYYLNRI